MDGQHFDTLVRALAEGRLTRRRAWRLLGGGALVSTALTTLADATAPAKSGRRDRGPGDRNRRFQCRATGRLCVHNPKKRNAGKSCKLCCGGVGDLLPDSPYAGRPDLGRCCTPNGRGCNTGTQCCLGECIAGTCQNSVVQLPAPPPPPSPPAPPPPAPPPPPTCRLYGETCAVTADCCNTDIGVLCLTGTCRLT